MKKFRWINLAYPGGVLLFCGTVLFFGRLSIAEFLGASVLFGVPMDDPSAFKVKYVGWAGVVLIILAIAAIAAELARWKDEV
jgi:hypothetical protein